MEDSPETLEDLERMMTIPVFLRRFFGPASSSRPQKRDVERWIRRGDAEGVFLRARYIDGKYYIRLADAQTFLESSRVAPIQRKDKHGNKYGFCDTQEETMRKLRELGVKI